MVDMHGSHREMEFKLRQGHSTAAEQHLQHQHDTISTQLEAVSTQFEKLTLKHQALLSQVASGTSQKDMELEDIMTKQQQLTIENQKLSSQLNKFTSDGLDTEKQLAELSIAYESEKEHNVELQKKLTCSVEQLTAVTAGKVEVDETLSVWQGKLERVEMELQTVNAAKMTAEADLEDLKNRYEPLKVQFELREKEHLVASEQHTATVTLLEVNIKEMENQKHLLQQQLQLENDKSCDLNRDWQQEKEMLQQHIHSLEEGETDSIKHLSEELSKSQAEQAELQHQLSAALAAAGAAEAEQTAVELQFRGLEEKFDQTQSRLKELTALVASSQHLHEMLSSEHQNLKSHYETLVKQNSALPSVQNNQAFEDLHEKHTSLVNEHDETKKALSELTVIYETLYQASAQPVQELAEFKHLQKGSEILTTKHELLSSRYKKDVIFEDFEAESCVAVEKEPEIKVVIEEIVAQSEPEQKVIQEKNEQIVVQTLELESHPVIEPETEAIEAQEPVLIEHVVISETIEDAPLQQQQQHLEDEKVVSIEKEQDEQQLKEEVVSIGEEENKTLLRQHKKLKEESQQQINYISDEVAKQQETDSERTQSIKQAMEIQYTELETKLSSSQQELSLAQEQLEAYEDEVKRLSKALVTLQIAHDVKAAQVEELVSAVDEDDEAETAEHLSNELRSARQLLNSTQQKLNEQTERASKLSVELKGIKELLVSTQQELKCKSDAEIVVQNQESEALAELNTKHQYLLAQHEDITEQLIKQRTQAQQYQELDSQHTELISKHNTVAIEYEQMFRKHTELTTQHDELATQQSILKLNYENLQVQHDELAKQQKQLIVDRDGQYHSLLAERDQLKLERDEVLLKHKKLQRKQTETSNNAEKSLLTLQVSQREEELIRCEQDAARQLDQQRLEMATKLQKLHSDTDELHEHKAALRLQEEKLFHQQQEILKKEAKFNEFAKQLALSEQALIGRKERIGELEQLEHDIRAVKAENNELRILLAEFEVRLSVTSSPEFLNVMNTSREANRRAQQQHLGLVLRIEDLQQKLANTLLMNTELRRTQLEDAKQVSENPVAEARILSLTEDLLREKRLRASWMIKKCDTNKLHKAFHGWRETFHKQKHLKSLVIKHRKGLALLMLVQRTYIRRISQPWVKLLGNLKDHS